MSIELLNNFVTQGNPDVGSIPFLVHKGKVTWSVASDGKFLVALKSALAEEGTPKVLKLLVPYLTIPAKQGFEVEVSKLLTWTGEPPSELPSEDPEDGDVGVILERVIDRKRVAWILSHLGTAKVYVWDTSEAGNWSIGFEWEGGRAILAGVKSEPEEGMSTFEPPKAELDQLLELAMEEE